MARGREPGTVKEAVDRLFEQAGGRKKVGDLFDLSPSQVAALADERSPEHLSVQRAAGLTSHAAPAMAEFFALRAGGLFLPFPPDETDLPQLCADDARAHGDAIAEIVTALRDGVIDRQEAARAKVKLRLSMRALTALYQAIDDRTNGGVK